MNDEINKTIQSLINETQKLSQKEADIETILLLQNVEKQVDKLGEIVKLLLEKTNESSTLCTSTVELNQSIQRYLVKLEQVDRLKERIGRNQVDEEDHS
ncbi:hypothetical protein DLAC_11836 [Tieghemostelium lacteum]|uniref:Uncharacterized protein n=1 Tax=Tieghemostelium lacteum TaxID=361077 RepID=A0A151Z2T7_TIELA|nr:hypothetical protein DLAC_11836 [Tieghemostelium lacteum]|eukprot:KYQ88261.1 hypothetical protein DLAC_11836 [Tieghemostelium lacteum]